MPNFEVIHTRTDQKLLEQVELQFIAFKKYFMRLGKIHEFSLMRKKKINLLLLK